MTSRNINNTENYSTWTLNMCKVLIKFKNLFGSTKNNSSYISWSYKPAATRPASCLGLSQPHMRVLCALLFFWFKIAKGDRHFFLLSGKKIFYDFAETLHTTRTLKVFLLIFHSMASRFSRTVFKFPWDCRLSFFGEISRKQILLSRLILNHNSLNFKT